MSFFLLVSSPCTFLPQRQLPFPIYPLFPMSDNDSVSSEPYLTSPKSAGVSPDLGVLSMDDHAEVDDDNRAQTIGPTTSTADTAHSSPAVHPAGSASSHHASSSASALPLSGLSSIPHDLPQSAARKPSPQVDEILRAIDQATNAKAPSTALPFPKHQVNLPVSFVSIALPVADVLRSLKPSIGSHTGKNFQSLLKQAVKLLNTNDTTRLEAAMITLHSLHLAASSNLGSHIALWEEHFSLWSEENKVLMREALDLFETMCTPNCNLSPCGTFSTHCRTSQCCPSLLYWAATPRRT